MHKNRTKFENCKTAIKTQFSFSSTFIPSLLHFIKLSLLNQHVHIYIRFHPASVSHILLDLWFAALKINIWGLAKERERDKTHIKKLLATLQLCIFELKRRNQPPQHP